MPVIGATAAPDQPATAPPALVNSVLWTQQSIEHRAASLAAYRAAGQALTRAARSNAWASLEHGPARSTRRAVVLDLDETVLDNTGYSAWMVRQDQPYTEPTWQQWMALETETAIPGALEFSRLAKRLGVAVFFVSNRECIPGPDDPCPAQAHTRSTLLRLGIEQASDRSALLLKRQRPEWNSDDKSSRRSEVAKTHRIVMMIGDDMGDFLPAANVERLRAGHADAETTAAMQWLGTRWFVIPNPVYGSWEKAVPASVGGRISVLQAPGTLTPAEAGKPLR